MNLSSIDWSRIVISISIGWIMSFTFSFGQYIQLIILDGFLGNAASLRDAAAPLALRADSPFALWFSSFYYWPHFPLSILVCYFAFRFKTARPIFLSLSPSIFMALSLADVILLTNENLDYTTLVNSIVSNLFGSFVLAALFTLFLYFSRKVVTDNHGGLAANLCFHIIISAAFLILMFSIVKNFFWPTSTDFSAKLSPNFYGTFVRSDSNKERFGLFTGQHKSFKTFNWAGQFSNMELRTKRALKSADVELYLFAGCGEKTTADLTSWRISPNASFTKVSDINMKINDGNGEFSILPVGRVTGHWTVNEANSTYMAVNKAKAKDEIILTLVSTGDRDLVHDQWQEGVWYRLDFSTAEVVKENDIKMVPRIITLSSPSSSVSYRLNTKENLGLNEIGKCRKIPVGSEGKAIAHIDVTALVKITYPRMQTLSDIRSGARTTVSGLQGWFRAEVPPANWKSYFSKGEVKDVSIVGSFDELFVKDTNIQNRSVHWLGFCSGIHSGSQQYNLPLDFSGRGDCVWVDGKRMNQTRWDQFKTESLWMWALGILLGISVYLIKVFVQLWMRNEPLL